MCLLPQQWSSQPWMAEYIRSQGHREEHVQTTLCKLLRRQEFVVRLVRGEVLYRTPLAAMGPIPGADPDQTAFVAKLLTSLVRKSEAEEEADLALLDVLRRARRPQFITGGPGSGKSLACRHLMLLARQRGFHVLRANPTGMLAHSTEAVMGVRSQTFHAAFGVGTMSLPDTAEKLKHYNLWIIGEVGMLSRELFDRMYAVYSDLGHEPVVVLEGDFQQLEPPTASGEDARCSRYWRWVQTTELSRQHRCEDSRLRAFASICRHSMPNGTQIAEFWNELCIGDELSEEVCEKAAEFV
ncbi:unnamed protein product, partial [Prorocentrum cordatum]